MGYSSSSDSEDGNIFDDPEIAAKYKKQRRERRKIKRGAVADLMQIGRAHV